MSSQSIHPEAITDVKNAIIARFGEYKLDYLFFQPVVLLCNTPTWTYFDEVAHRYFGLRQNDELSDNQIKAVLARLVA